MQGYTLEGMRPRTLFLFLFLVLSLFLFDPFSVFQFPHFPIFPFPLFPFPHFLSPVVRPPPLSKRGVAEQP